MPKPLFEIEFDLRDLQRFLDQRKTRVSSAAHPFTGRLVEAEPAETPLWQRAATEPRRLLATALMSGQYETAQSPDWNGDPVPGRRFWLRNFFSLGEQEEEASQRENRALFAEGLRRLRHGDERPQIENPMSTGDADFSALENAAIRWLLDD